MFAESIGADGFNLRDLAILASTAQHLVHMDQQAILLRVCELFGHPTVGPIDHIQMRELILMYEAVFLIGADSKVDIRSFSAVQANKLLRLAPKAYPGWDDVVMFVDDEIESHAFNTQNSANPFRSRDSSLQTAFRIVEHAADHFARHLAELECQEIREDLLEYERGDTGRIRLADFYRAGLTSRFFFVETKEYLQAVGALDDSDTIWGPKVIVSNYVLSKSNCLAHSNSYSICCINECDSLYAKLEDSVDGFEATPERIAAFAAALSSSTVQAPRNLSQSLLQRLDEIAAGHGGDVLLHTRLFAQWMHQAFPRECPYPHLQGTLTSLSPTEWVKHHGMPYRVDHKGSGSRMDALNKSVEVLERNFDDNNVIADEQIQEIMWSVDEETFVVPTRSLPKRFLSAVGTMFTRAHMMFFAAVCTFFATAIKATQLFCAPKASQPDSVFV
jgi:hypothetical protein